MWEEASVKKGCMWAQTVLDLEFGWVHSIIIWPCGFECWDLLVLEEEVLILEILKLFFLFFWELSKLCLWSSVIRRLALTSK